MSKVPVPRTLWRERGATDSGVIQPWDPLPCPLMSGSAEPSLAPSPLLHRMDTTTYSRHCFFLPQIQGSVLSCLLSHRTSLLLHWMIRTRLAPLSLCLQSGQHTGGCLMSCHKILGLSEHCIMDFSLLYKRALVLSETDPLPVKLL